MTPTHVEIPRAREFQNNYLMLLTVQDHQIRSLCSRDNVTGKGFPLPASRPTKSKNKLNPPLNWPFTKSNVVLGIESCRQV